MYIDRVRERGESKLAARRQVGALLDLNPATLRNWVEREQINTGTRRVVTVSCPPRSRPCAGSTPSCGAPMRSSRRHRRVHTGGARPPTQVIIACIDGRKARFAGCTDLGCCRSTGCRSPRAPVKPRSRPRVSARELTGVYLVDAVVACFPRPPRGLGVTHAVAPAAPRRSRGVAVTRSDG